MAIQPIDMQTMYSQLNNVAKNAGAQQQAQLSEAMQQQSNIQKKINSITSKPPVGKTVPTIFIIAPNFKNLTFK